MPVKTDESGETRTAVAANTYCIRYAEEQAGFLAGYAAVFEGYTKLGFIGGMKVPAVIRYGYGFVQGADYAAKELGIKNVSIKYNYTGSFEAVSYTHLDVYKRQGTKIYSLKDLASVTMEGNYYPAGDGSSYGSYYGSAYDTGETVVIQGGSDYSCLLYTSSAVRKTE